MRKSRKALVVFSVSFFLTFAAIQSVLVTAQEWPAWVPTVDDIDEYELLWQNSTEFENYYDPDAENITSYGQFWYKNDTANEVAAIAAFQMMDFGEKPWNQEISSQYSTILNTYVPEFEGETSWDLMVYFLNMSVGGEMEDIAAELEWDKAVLMNFSGSLFDHLIVGTLDTKFVVSYALKMNYDWFSYAQTYMRDYYQQIGFAFSNMISSFLMIGNQLSSTSESPLSASAEGLIATQDSEETSVEELKTITASVGESIKEDIGGGGIDGTPLYIVGILASFTVLALIRNQKKKRTLVA